MVARKITGLLYKINRVFGSAIFIECPTQKELFEYVADLTIKGVEISSVNQICFDGSTPKIRVFTDMEFKKILQERKKENGQNIKPHRA